MAEVTGSMELLTSVTLIAYQEVIDCDYQKVYHIIRKDQEDARGNLKWLNELTSLNTNVHFEVGCGISI
ncbi:hypothetical protein ACTXT7_008531 [Hymenolepis weldensis]